MDASDWISIIIAAALAGVGLWLSFKSGVALARVEEQNKKFDNIMNRIVDRLLKAQVEALVLLVRVTSKSEQLTGTDIDDEDLSKEVERLRNELFDDDERDNNDAT